MGRLVADQSQESGGTGLCHLGQILTPLLRSLVLHQAAQIRASNFVGADPRSPTGVGALFRVRAYTLSCTEVTSNPVPVLDPILDQLRGVA